MKILILMLCVTTVNLKILSEVKNSAIFIEDIKNWLRITHLIFLYDDRAENTEETNFIFKISRLLIMKRIQVLSLKIKNLEFFDLVYEKEENEPLIIVYLSNTNSLEEFEQFSKKVNMKWAFWLIIFLTRFKSSNNYCPNPLRNFFHLEFNSKVIIKCFDDEILHEWFLITDNQIQVNNLARWNLENHLFNKSTTNLLKRRNNIGGKILRTTIIKLNKGSLTRKSSGIYLEILGELGKVMNFTYSIVSEQSQYGAVENGNWTGVMKIISSEEADIGAVGMSMTRKRIQSIDFTQPILDTYKALYFRQPSSILRFGYFQAFHGYVWGVLILLLITISICLTYMMIEKENYSTLPFVFQENFLNVWGIYCQQGIAEFPKKGSLRILYCVTFMLSIVLLSAYSASLISRLAVSVPKIPFSTLKEFVNQKSYKMIVIKKGESFDSIKNSQDEYSKKMQKLLRKEEILPSSFSQGFNMICMDKYSVFLVEQSAEASIDDFLSCALRRIPTTNHISLALPLPKDSPYTEVFNYHLQKFKEYGIISRIVNQQKRREINSEFKSIDSISLEGIDTIFVIVLYSLVLSIVILVLEKIHYHYCEKRERQQRNQKIALFFHTANLKKYSEQTINRTHEP